MDRETLSKKIVEAYKKADKERVEKNKVEMTQEFIDFLAPIRKLTIFQRLELGLLELDRRGNLNMNLEKMIEYCRDTKPEN
jgi:hypothetical protein